MSRPKRCNSPELGSYRGCRVRKGKGRQGGKVDQVVGDGKDKPLNAHLSLLFLFALGSWGKTPTPANDPNAPSSAGNEGELTLQIDGQSQRFLIQSARLTPEQSPYLLIEGERIGGAPQFVLSAESPNPKLPEDFGKLEHVPLPLAPSSVGEDLPVAGGRLRLLQITGSGPWEIDADVELDTPLGMVQGSLQARVQSA